MGTARHWGTVVSKSDMYSTLMKYAIKWGIQASSSKDNLQGFLENTTAKRVECE